MPRHPCRRLVIDASVARSCGGPEAKHPTSAVCRDFLLAVLDTAHRVAMTQEISDEWNRHQSSHARGWRVEMASRRRTEWVDVPTNEPLRHRIVGTSPDWYQQEALLKDLHLLEAALATDRTIISRDDKARDLFAAAAGTVAKLRRVAWVNPAQPEEQALAWLEHGACAERARCLGAAPVASDT